MREFQILTRVGVNNNYNLSFWQLTLHHLNTIIYYEIRIEN